MKETNPIIPPGLNFEGASRGRSKMRMAVIVVVLLHLALFTGILFNACKQKEDADEGAKSINDEMLEIAGPAPKAKNETLPDPVPTPPIGAGDGNANNMFNPPPIIDNTHPIPTGVGMENTTMVPPISSGTTVPPAGSFATSPAPIPPPPVTGTTEHVVAKGDSFYSIGRKYGVGMNAVAKANPNVIPTRMRIGQKLIIPAAAPARVTALPTPDAPNVYTVKRGDTLGHIALKYRTKVSTLKSLNGLSTDFLKIGQKLAVPMRTSAPPAPVPTASAPAVSPSTGMPISVPTPPVSDIGSTTLTPPPPAE